MRAARNATRSVLFVIAFAVGFVSCAPSVAEAQQSPMVREARQLHLQFVREEAHPLVAGNVATLEPTTLGWRYVGVVHVYDGTGGKAPWKVPEAFTEWSAHTGLDVAFVSDPAAAQIAVYEVDQFTAYTGSALGVAYYPSRTDGIATSQCRVELASWVADLPVTAEHTAIHETGHCLGLAHNTVDKRTVMAPSVQLGTGYTKPQSADLRNLRTLYP